MDFSLDPDQLALRDAVRRFCNAEYPAPARGNAEPAALARQRHGALAELGVLGLSIAPEHGGAGLGAVASMLVAHELGRALHSGNWLPNAVLVPKLLAEVGSTAWLPELAGGKLQMALACQEEAARHELADVRTRAQVLPDGGWQLRGSKTLVLGGAQADVFIVVARSAGGAGDQSGLSLFAVPVNTPGLVVRATPLLDGRGAAQLELHAVSLGATALLGHAGQAWPAIEAATDAATAAVCAEAAGALQALLEITCEHLRTRQQFGQPLARFQALQHQVAELGMALEELLSMACLAAMALDAGEPAQIKRYISAAKTLVAQRGRRCALAAIQLHGAMGMTDECRAGHYAKRLLCIGQLFGDAAHHLKRYFVHSHPQGAHA